jgi:predicted DNA-binding transcriptional regulator YafY
MRTSRLLTIQMLLQSRGRMSAGELAQTLEVSLRTLHRDIDALTASGVPVYAERGRAGGFELMEGWKTTLTGLTPDEAKVVLLAGLGGPAAQLGLGRHAQDAQLKVLAAMPQGQRHTAQLMQSRFHLDPLDWYRESDPTPHLQTVAQAVWDARQLRIRYASWRAVSVQRVHPLGLVLKAGIWYLVAARDKTTAQARTYRVASIEDAQVLDAAATLPKRFDLAAHWQASLVRFEQSLHTGSATVRATSEGVQALRRLNVFVARAVDAQLTTQAPNAAVLLRIPMESIAHTARQLLPLSPDVVAVSPPELRAEMVEIAQQLLRLHATQAV